METKVNNPVLIYTERTPNPESLKFVSNKMLYRGTADFQERELAEKYSPLAKAIFEFPFVKGVYISNNFVTVSKEMNYVWEDVMLQVKSFIKTYIESEAEIVSEAYETYLTEESSQATEKVYTGEEGELVARIKDLLETYVKPAVAGDGGNIEFQSFEDGVVSVLLQGACSGCPSSTVTLKSGIEGMLKRMIPEVKAVEAYMG